jgi:hypothetical protein
VIGAVIPQTRQTGLRDDYRGMFPGAVIVTDGIPARPLWGRRKVRGCRNLWPRGLAAGEQERDFAKLVRRREWQDWVAAMGLAPRLLSGHTLDTAEEVTSLTSKHTCQCTGRNGGC